MHAEVARLAARVAASLQGKSLRARTVTLKVRYGDFVTVTRSHTDASPTADPAGIGARARLLLARTEAGARPVRLLGVGAHGLVESGAGEPASGWLELNLPAGGG
jgi:DNA polymerase-4